MTAVFISAGEASGDLHGANLLKALKHRIGDVDYFGLGGDLLREQGVSLIYDLPDLAVTGFWEVAKRIFHFRKVYMDCLREIGNRNPSLAILIDYPGMNLRLAKALRSRGCRVVYYIAPQVC